MFHISDEPSKSLVRYLLVEEGCGAFGYGFSCEALETITTATGLMSVCLGPFHQ